MLVRREAIESVGSMDERFFLYCEETDYCLRVHQAGWEIRHFPQTDDRPPCEQGRLGRRLAAQAAFARRQYMAKHFSPVHRVAGIAALGLGYALLRRAREPRPATSTKGGAGPRGRRSAVLPGFPLRRSGVRLARRCRAAAAHTHPGETDARAAGDETGSRRGRASRESPPRTEGRESLV